MFDRIAPSLEKRLYTGQVHPIIVKVKRGAAREFWAEVKQYELSRFSSLSPRIAYGLGLLPSYVGPIEAFDMVSGVFGLLDIEYFADHPLVERIYYDQPAVALSETKKIVPTVPKEGIYRMTRPTLIFTTTYWTSKILGAEDCWKMGITGKGVKVAVPDTGVALAHPQIGLRPLAVAYSSVYEWNRSDNNGHGTWCCTAIAGAEVVDTRLSHRVKRKLVARGLAPDVDLHCIKCLDYVIGSGSTSGIIRALEIAYEWGAKVISMSLGGEEEAEKPEDDPFYPVMDKLVKKGVIPVVAAGNSGPKPGTVGTPGALPNVLTVGAYDPVTGSLARFSSRGPTPWGDVKPDVVAPGVNILSGAQGLLDVAVERVVDDYGVLSGTSMATPHAAAVVALASQYWREKLGRELTLDEVKEAMRAYWEDVLGREKSNSWGWGPITCDVLLWWAETGSKPGAPGSQPPGPPGIQPGGPPGAR